MPYFWPSGSPPGNYGVLAADAAFGPVAVVSAARGAAPRILASPVNVYAFQPATSWRAGGMRVATVVWRPWKARRAWLATLELLDRRGSHAHGHLGSRMLAEHTAVGAGDLDVIVDADPRDLPFCVFVVWLRQCVHAAYPVRQLVAPGGLQAGVVGCPQHGDDELGVADFAGGHVGDDGGLCIVPLQSPLASARNQRHSVFRGKSLKFFIPYKSSFFQNHQLTSALFLWRTLDKYKRTS